ncbi:hypothetical protein T439DRAFT_325992 [Meredithblackwellia eburnea MCA 4105]
MSIQTVPLSVSSSSTTDGAATLAPLPTGNVTANWQSAGGLGNATASGMATHSHNQGLGSSQQWTNAPTSTLVDSSLNPSSQTQYSATPTVTYSTGGPSPTSQGQGQTLATKGAFDWQTLHGNATWFESSKHVTVCRVAPNNTDFVVAVPSSIYNAGVNSSSSDGVSSVCGQQITITNLLNQMSVNVWVADMCAYCPSETSLDLSKIAFQSIATGDLSSGVLDIVWGFTYSNSTDLSQNSTYSNSSGHADPTQGGGHEHPQPQGQDNGAYPSQQPQDSAAGHQAMPTGTLTSSYEWGTATPTNTEWSQQSRVAQAPGSGAEQWNGNVQAQDSRDEHGQGDWNWDQRNSVAGHSPTGLFGGKKFEPTETVTVPISATSLSTTGSGANW